MVFQGFSRPPNIIIPFLKWNICILLFFFRSAPAAGGAPATEGGAPQQPPNLTSNRRLQQTQAQVDEVSTSLPLPDIYPHMITQKH